MPSFNYTCVSLITYNPDNKSINISAYAEFSVWARDML